MFEIGTATNHEDLLNKLNTFLTAKGSAFGLTYSGTGNGTLTGYSGGTGGSIDTWTITATSSTSFDVVGANSGPLGTATVGAPFVDTQLAFLITAGGTPFAAGDSFVISTAAKWLARRAQRGCVVTASQGNTGKYACQNLVDGKTAVDENRYWQVMAPLTLPIDIEFTLRVARTVVSYEVAAFSAADGGGRYEPTDWTFDYWNGSAWITKHTAVGITSWGDTEVKKFSFSGSSATRYRLHITGCLQPTVKIRLGAVRLRQTTQSQDVAFSAFLWETTGNAGMDVIQAGAHVFERSDADYYNWELAVFDGHNSAAPFYGQPGFQGQMYLPLWDGSIPYWFICDGRRVIVVAKINAQYEVAYLGFLDPYFTPFQWPYPMAIGGTLAFNVEEGVPYWDDVRFRWSNATNQHRLFTHSDAWPGTYPPYTAKHQMRTRDVDGAYRGYEATDNDGVSSPPVASRNLIWPFRCGLSLLDKNLDGSYALWPIMLCSSAPNTIGQLSGVMAVTGQDLTAETLIRKGQIDWLVVQNINRNDRDDFIAIALD